MRWRGAAAVLLLAGLGAAGGYAGATALDVPSAGTATPLPANSPSVPVDPPPVRVPDPAVAPLALDVPTRRSQLGAEGFEISFPTPRGWRRTFISPVEARWVRPGNPSHTYVLRVEHVLSLRETIDATLQARLERLDAETEEFTVVEQTPSSLHFTYLDAGHLRHGLLRWLDLNGRGVAELEVALTGREVDLDGMESLMSAVVRGAR